MVKKKSQKSLTKWTKQKWDYITKADKKKPKSKRGRYLPKSVRAKMTPSQKAASNQTVKNVKLVELAVVLNTLKR